MPSGLPFAELMGILVQDDPGAASLVWERFARRLTALAADRLPGVFRAPGPTPKPSSC
jgi:hypothetical protein